MDILIGKGDEKVYLKSEMINRHGLIAGATGTGKTTTLRVIVEALSELGVPVFLPDVKGDIFSLTKPGDIDENISERINFIGMDFNPRAYDIELWDVFGEMGHPVRTTISEMGPLLLSNLLDLNEVQEGILNIVFRVADDEGLLLLDLKDLKSMLQYVLDNAKELRGKYGNISSASVCAIQRSLLVLENEGADYFFGEPALEIEDIIRQDSEGGGVINILNSKLLHQKPRLYATFMVWILSELYENLPEVGDNELPKLVFFFDEAHILFQYGSKVLIEKLTQVVRLIRSKGVGIFFVTQRPNDIPEEILSQLGNKIQHALRAFTPKDRKAIKETAQNFRDNPNFSTEEVLTNMPSGYALVSTLDADGLPNITEKTMIAPPKSSFEALSANEIRELIPSDMDKKYRNSVDRESAFEILEERILLKKEQDEKLEAEEAKRKEEIRRDQDEARAERQKKRNKSELEKQIGRMTNSALNSMSRTLGNKILRGILGGLIGKK
ncbi:MAG: DUF853 family protein [Firmicutes bacterium]|nr:DUF853 family protein [Bacillota bacterium]